jgi:glycosyltransferase involved in cell wall biosynthesis
MPNLRGAISALIPIRNGALHLQNLRNQLANTLLEQDEIILVNDGSEDQTFTLLQIWAQEDSRIQLLNNNNHGIANALNLGLDNASNNWIARFDVDDVYRSDRIEQQFLSVSNNTVCVFSDYSFQTITRKSLGYVPSAVCPAATSISLISGQRTPHPVALMNREAVLAVGGYRQEDFPAEDLSLWLRLSRVGDLTSSPQSLLNYTINPIGVSQTKRKQQIAMKNLLIETIGINPPDMLEIKNNSLQILESYDSFQNPFIRKLLLIREFKKLANTQGNSSVNSLGYLLRSIRISDVGDIADFSFSTFGRKARRLTF